jgi:hypothetical protein
MQRDSAAGLYKTYAGVIGTLIGMMNHAEAWILPGKTNGSDHETIE